jgi:hypothetical protein
MPTERLSGRTVSAPAPSHFEFVERQLERTLERIVGQHVIRRTQQHAASDGGRPTRLRLRCIDGGAATT